MMPTSVWVKLDILFWIAQRSSSLAKISGYKRTMKCNVCEKFENENEERLVLAEKKLKSGCFYGGDTTMH